MKPKRMRLILVSVVLTLGLVPVGNAVAMPSGVGVTVDTIGTPATAKPGATDVRMMNINITPGSTGDTLVKLTVTYTGTATADVGTVRLYDGAGLVQGQSLTSGRPYST